MLRLHRVLALGLGLAAAAAALPAGASAAPASVLGVPCSEGPGGITQCTGSLLARVPTWDGVPLDVDIYLPPDDGKPDPLIVGLHGFGVTKLGAFGFSDYPVKKAQQGYAVIGYSARGQGFSCGVVVSRTPGCEEGWIHLADARYEARDTQYLAGLLVDEGLVKPKRIGVTGSSYGGGQSLMLATLRNRTMLPDGSLVPWTSPAGVPMEIAAAAPLIGWSDLAYALVPTGRKLDFRARNPYGPRPGIVKFSYLQGLYTVGLAGFYAPPGADDEADITTWKAALDAGPPYDKQLLRHILREFRRYHSPLSVQDRLPRADRVPPAPTVIYNGWTDDIMPPDQALHYYAMARKRFPGHEPAMVMEATYAHNRGSLTATPVLHDAASDELFARELMGDREARALDGVTVTTQGCNGQPVIGPLVARSWRGLHPGEVRARGGRAEQATTSAGGNPQNAAQTDPFFGGECRTLEAADDPGAATFVGKPAGDDGYTLVGSPTIKARLRITGRFAQLSSRLWDVAPDGQQTLVQHSIYKPRKRRDRPQVWQLHPQGWHFAPGHRPKLELLGADSPYMQAPASNYEIKVRRLRLELPVNQRPDGAQIKKFTPPR